MINLLKFNKTICSTVLLLVTALTLVAMAQSQTPMEIKATTQSLLPAEIKTPKQSLTSVEIKALSAQLSKAQQVSSALDSRLQCYVAKDTRLQVRSIQLQQTAGDLHRREQQLSSEQAQAESEAEAYRREFRAVQRKMKHLNSKRRTIEVKIRAEQAELDDCKRQLWIFGFSCDIAGEILGLNSELRKLSAAIQATDIKRTALQPQLHTAQVRQDQAAKRYQKTRSKWAKTQRDIVVAEAEITAIKASLAEIRTLKQDYSIELDNFRNTFAEFKGLEPASDRRSVIRRLRREAANLNDLLVNAQGLLTRKACNS